eukprot:8300915-Heterocapsa_arctica.AAC.1
MPRLDKTHKYGTNTLVGQKLPGKDAVNIDLALARKIVSCKVSGKEVEESHFDCEQLFLLAAEV